MPKSRKQQLMDSHEKKMMDLYESYYKKALDGDNQAFKPFIDVSKELFADGEENELMNLLKNAKVEE